MRDLARIGDETAFLRFVRACAARAAQLLNVAELARDADVAPDTARHWLSVLEASGIVFLLQPCHTNVTKRLVKSPKVCFLDTGLCSWLTGWTTPEALEVGAASGAMLETWILVEILKSWWHRGKQAPFHCFRNKDKEEIDLLIVRDDAIHPLEFKKSASPGRDAARQFGLLARPDRPVGPGGVVCLAESSLPLVEGVVTIPVGAIQGNLPDRPRFSARGRGTGPLRSRPRQAAPALAMSLFLPGSVSGQGGIAPRSARPGVPTATRSDSARRGTGSPPDVLHGNRTP